MRLALVYLLMSAMLMPGLAQGADVQQLIDDAIASGQKQLTLEPGVYRLPAKPNRPQLLIKGARDLTIIANGVTLVSTSLDQVLRIQDSQYVELRGVSLDYDPLPFTQGVVTAKADDDTWMDVRLDAGYPQPQADGYKRAIIHDAQTGQVKANTWTRFGARITPQEHGMVRIAWSQPVRDAATVGDRVSITLKNNTPHALMLERSSNCTLRDVTVMASTSFGIFEYMGGTNQYLGCAVRPGLPPAGATATRLLASNADGLHSKQATRGPRIEGCTLDSMGDDGIAINGSFVLIAAASGNRVIVSPQNHLPLSVGDRLHGISHNGTATADAKIISIKPADADSAPDAKKIQLKYYPDLRLAENAFKNSYELELDQSLPLEAGYLAASPDRNGSNFVVRGNTVRNTRARGILIKASYGVIEKNIIEHISLAGIVLCPETRYWHEADYSRDVVIRGNTLTNVLTGPTNTGVMQPGAISLCSEGDGKTYGPAGGHRNITIEDNRIERAPGVQILVTSATDVRVQGNHFVKPILNADGNGSAYGIDTSKPIWVTQSDQVKVEANRQE